MTFLEFKRRLRKVKNVGVQPFNGLFLRVTKKEVLHSAEHGQVYAEFDPMSPWCWVGTSDGELVERPSPVPKDGKKGGGQ